MASGTPTITDIQVLDEATEVLKQYFVEYLKGDMGDRYKTTENRI